jgi:hypothetical protein
MAKVSISIQAPEFTSQDVHGNAVSLSNFANKKMCCLYSIADLFDPSAAGIWRSCVRIMKALRTWILKF